MRRRGTRRRQVAPRYPARSLRSSAMLGRPRCDDDGRFRFSGGVRRILGIAVNAPRVSAFAFRSGDIDLDPVQRVRAGPRLRPHAAARRCARPACRGCRWWFRSSDAARWTGDADLQRRPPADDDRRREVPDCKAGLVTQVRLRRDHRAAGCAPRSRNLL